MTLHRLLRQHPGNSTRFRHHRGNRLPHDLVVVDEASMVSLTMMARLLEAVRPEARLVLVGDPDQLSSVDAGAVLTDLVRGYEHRADSPVAALTTAHRYGAEIGALAEALRLGDADAAIAALQRRAARRSSGSPTATPRRPIRATVLPHALAVRDAAVAGDADAGARPRSTGTGCSARTATAPSAYATGTGASSSGSPPRPATRLYDSAYLGRPILVTSNDYVARRLQRRHRRRRRRTRTGRGPRSRPEATTLDLAPSRLGDVETMHAMTIHKSQGSQADEVTVLLPDEESRLLTRELFYTAVTRAQRKVRVIGPESAVRAAIATAGATGQRAACPAGGWLKRRRHTGPIASSACPT